MFTRAPFQIPRHRIDCRLNRELPARAAPVRCVPWPNHLINVNDFLTTCPKDIARSLVGPIITRASTRPETRDTRGVNITKCVGERCYIQRGVGFILRRIERFAVKHSVRGRGRRKYEFTFRSKLCTGCTAIKSLDTDFLHLRCVQITRYTKKG